MAKRNERLVVIMLGQSDTQEFEIWPLHITIVPWFHSEDDEKLDAILQKIAMQHQTFNVKAGHVEEWGKKEKFNVQILEDADKLRQLHLDVFNTLENTGFPIHQKDFLGDKYTPHLALRNRYQKGRAFEKGTKLAIKNFSLINQNRLKVSGRMIKSVAKDYELRG